MGGGRRVMIEKMVVMRMRVGRERGSGMGLLRGIDGVGDVDGEVR